MHDYAYLQGDSSLKVAKTETKHPEGSLEPL